MRLEISRRAGLTARTLVALHAEPVRVKRVDLADTLGTTAGLHR